MTEIRVEPKSHRRLVILFCGLLIWAAIIAGRLIQLQVFQHSELRRQAETQQMQKMDVKAPRGAIFDRNGQALAMSVPGTSVSINPMRIADVGMAADILSGALNLDRALLMEKISTYRANKKGFLLLKRHLELAELTRIQEYAKRLDYIAFQQTSVRHYPKGSLAAHLLGGVNFKEEGDGGLELALDEELEGQTGKVELLHDVKQRGVDSKIYSEAMAGKDITLSIDQRIQFVAEQVLEAHAKKNGTPTGSVVVMRPSTGDILAMASYPNFNPNDSLADTKDLKVMMKRRLNQAVAAPFEPGSVFKVITMAAALEHTNLTPGTWISCGGGKINLFGRVIHDHDSYGSLTMTDVLAKSSNIGAIQVGLRVGDKNMYDTIRKFGFGAKIGLPLFEESAGKVRPLRRWQKSSIGSIAMGHELTTTTVQLAQACAIVANHGRWVKPRLVIKAQREGLAPEVMVPEQGGKVLSPETAMTLRKMMEQVVLSGTGKLAKVRGYSIGGKTGSAQIFDFEHKVYTHRYNASFMGFAPVANPEVVVIVTLNGASKLAGAVAAPAFQEVMASVLRILNVPKDVPIDEPEPKEIATSQNDLSIAALSGSNDLLNDDEEDSKQDAPGDNRPLVGPVAPNFQGLSKRAVLEQSTAKGIRVSMEGSGIARRQIPAPGKVLAQGESIRVVFAR